ncbi:asl4372 [Nostoc sp. PCC 7120 = FACHB-418]|nr:asl4372 [Nostoc sp. PCC 7120 = FACHB-418]
MLTLPNKRPLESKIAIKIFPNQCEVIDFNNKFYQLHRNFSIAGSCIYATVYHELRNGDWQKAGKARKEKNCGLLTNDK